MFYYNESSTKLKNNITIYQELLEPAFSLLQLYFLHTFKIRDIKYKQLFMRMFVSQLNAYEMIGDLQKECIDEMNEHRTMTYVIGNSEAKNRYYSDFCGLLMDLRNKEEQLIKQLNPMLVKDESLKEYLSYHQQCLYTIQYLLKEMTNEDGSKCFDEMEGNYFDPFVPYFENKVKK